MGNFSKYLMSLAKSDQARKQISLVREMQVFEVKNSPCTQQNETITYESTVTYVSSIITRHSLVMVLPSAEVSTTTTRNHHLILKSQGDSILGVEPSALWDSFNVLKTCLHLQGNFLLQVTEKHNLTYLTLHMLCFSVTKTLTGRHALSLLNLQFSLILSAPVSSMNILFLAWQFIMQQHYQVPLTTWYML